MEFSVGLMLILLGFFNLSGLMQKIVAGFKRSSGFGGGGDHIPGAAVAHEPRPGAKPSRACTICLHQISEGRHEACYRVHDPLTLRHPVRIAGAAGMFKLDGAINCPGCHAKVERTKMVLAEMTPLLLVLWREQYPQGQGTNHAGFQRARASAEAVRHSKEEKGWD
jgi:hypothetical protein